LLGGQLFGLQACLALSSFKRRTFVCSLLLRRCQRLLPKRLLLLRLAPQRFLSLDLPSLGFLP